MNKVEQYICFPTLESQANAKKRNLHATREQQNTQRTAHNLQLMLPVLLMPSQLRIGPTSTNRCSEFHSCATIRRRRFPVVDVAIHVSVTSASKTLRNCGTLYCPRTKPEHTCPPFRCQVVPRHTGHCAQRRSAGDILPAQPNPLTSPDCR